MKMSGSGSRCTMSCSASATTCIVNTDFSARQACTPSMSCLRLTPADPSEGSWCSSSNRCAGGNGGGFACMSVASAADAVSGAMPSSRGRTLSTSGRGANGRSGTAYRPSRSSVQQSSSVPSTSAAGGAGGAGGEPAATAVSRARINGALGSKGRISRIALTRRDANSKGSMCGTSKGAFRTSTACAPAEAPPKCASRDHNRAGSLATTAR